MLNNPTTLTDPTGLIECEKPRCNDDPFLDEFFLRRLFGGSSVGPVNPDLREIHGDKPGRPGKPAPPSEPPPFKPPPTIGPAPPPPLPPPPDERPSCGSVFLSALLGGGDKLPTDEGVKQAAEAASAAAAAKAWRHAAARGLPYPLKSSIVRGWLGLSDALAFVGEVAPVVFAAYEILPAEARAIKANVKGECRPELASVPGWND